jgi:hypothetical protein
MVIYKYLLRAADDVKIVMPSGAQVLSVQVQHGAPCLWALVDSGAPLVDRHFKVFGTGNSVPKYSSPLPFVGTFQLEGGALVFHVFEVPEFTRAFEAPE